MRSLEELATLLDGRLEEVESELDAEVSAAVAAIVRRGARGLELLFIERVRRAGDPWSGQMAFPGGRVEARDASPLETAIRETREELSLDLRAATLLGRLADQAPYSAPGALRVAVFLFALEPPEVELRPNCEVEEALWLPLEDLLDADRYRDYRWPRYPERTFPAVVVDADEPQASAARVIWGLTHRMLGDLFARLGRRLPG